MKCKIVVEDSLSPASDVLVHWLRHHFKSAPSHVAIEIDHQPPPGDTKAEFKERLRIAARESERLMRTESGLDWGVYVVLTTLDLMRPQTRQVALSRGIVIYSIRHRNGVEWLTLEVKKGIAMTDDQLSHVFREHEEIVDERRLMDQHATSEEEIMRNTFIQGIRLAIDSAQKATPPTSSKRH